jgi:hypothetical protein
VVAETDVAAGRLTDEEKVGALMLLSSMSGLVLADEGGVLRLRCSMPIVEDDLASMSMFSVAAATQQWTASQLASSLAEFGVAALKTAHPSNGRRADPSPGIAGFVEQVLANGAQPSRWHDPVEFSELADTLLTKGFSLADLDYAVPAISVPIGFGAPPKAGADQESPTLVRVLVRDGHQRLGNGLVLLLTLPPSARTMRPDLTPLRLKTEEAEASRATEPMCLGSWAYLPRGPQRSEWVLAYVSFVPNIAYVREWLRNAMFGMVNRGAWASRLFHSSAD